MSGHINCMLLQTKRCVLMTRCLHGGFLKHGGENKRFIKCYLSQCKKSYLPPKDLTLTCPTFTVDRRSISTTTVCFKSIQEMVDELESGMYSAHARARKFEVRNTVKLVPSYTLLPTFDWKKVWMLHILPKYCFRDVDEHFSTSVFLRGADMAAECILEMIKHGDFKDLDYILNNKILDEVKSNYRRISSELQSFLDIDVLTGLEFQYERSLCDYKIKQLNGPDDVEADVTGILRGVAEIGPSIAQYLHKSVAPAGVPPPRSLSTLDLNIHFIFTCTRRYFRQNPLDDWTISGFTFLLEVPELYCVYLL